MPQGIRVPLSIVATIALTTVAYAQKVPTSEPAYIAKAMTAAPEAVSKGATIVAMSNGRMRTLQKGTNGFTCMVMPDGTPMCTDPAGMKWLHAVMTHRRPPNQVGFMYMLAGDNGASNTDPGATGPTPGNHWVKTGPHVMILGPEAKTMAGYPKSLNADPSKPYVMWPGTPYAHLMIPVK